MQLGFGPRGPHNVGLRRLIPAALQTRMTLSPSAFPDYPFQPHRIEIRPGIAMSLPRRRARATAKSW
jgi:hypothetical protein